MRTATSNPAWSGDAYLSIREAADYLQISDRTLFKWRKKGLPTYQEGGVIRFRRKEIDAWMAERQDEGEVARTFK